MTASHDRQPIADESPPAIEARGISKTFPSERGEVRALVDASVAIRRNEFFTLLGPSGCGKTTLLRLVAGFEHPSAGELLLDGEPLGDLPPHRRPVNTVFQSYALFPHLDVFDNVAFGLRMRRAGEDAVRDRVAEMLELVRLADFARRRPGQLSGGQQQRVALARALASQPRVLLLDEPLSALDLKLRKEMQIELKTLQLETGITFVFVTHDQEEALTMSDRVAVMDDGRILQIGTPHEIYEHPASRFVADFIGESNFLDARLQSSDARTGVFALADGSLVEVSEAAGRTASGPVTLAVRPERVGLGPPGADGAVPGTVDGVVYLGTDTTYHVRLAAGERLQVRVQNRRGAAAEHRRGDAVGVVLPPHAVRVLEQA